ncbi:hypothetical protein Egran_03705 [Elaphomyces granulatus]|uniref:DNA-directed RNA polymerase subunit n=1 Tax=Elaphomyces granulatus TaxID=519963 RepID=A0A232LWP0_9EURO|nr:hypothetical protein Egran_03705 [Elaphomyces granulatus]
MNSDSDYGIASASPALPGRKRKHKDKHLSPSKKRKHGDTEINLIATDAVPKSPKKSKKSKKRHKHESEPVASISTNSESNSPFNLVTSTMYLPLSPISISPTHTLASLLAEHLSPLLLTYYPPFKGVVLAYSDASISSTPPLQPVTEKDPRPLTLALTANEYGVLFVYLTATFLVFRPQRGQTLEGWVNVQSDGFLGVVVFNLFSVSIERRRLPTDWEWIHPRGEEGEREREGKNRRLAKGSSAGVSTRLNHGFDPEKEHFTPLSKPLTDGPVDSVNHLEQEQDWDSTSMGYFRSISGHRVHGTIKFRVHDVDVIPGADTDRWSLSIEGTMLTPEEETRLVAEERKGNYSTARRSSMMSGALAPPSGQPIDGDGEAEQVDEGIENSATKGKKEKKSKRKEEHKLEKTKENKPKRKEEHKDKRKSSASTSKLKSKAQ